MSIVENIICYKKKGEAGIELETAELITNQGIERDYHNTSGERQITIVSKELKDWMGLQKTKGFCFDKFFENIVISDIDLSSLKEYTILKIGETRLKISPFRKKCSAEFCDLEKYKQPCRLFFESRFASVEKGGILIKGATVEIEKSREK